MLIERYGEIAFDVEYPDIDVAGNVQPIRDAEHANRVVISLVLHVETALPGEELFLEVAGRRLGEIAIERCDSPLEIVFRS